MTSLWIEKKSGFLLLLWHLWPPVRLTRVPLKDCPHGFVLVAFGVWRDWARWNCVSRAGCNERLGEAGCLICKSGPIWTNYTAIICLFLQDKCSNVGEIRRSLPGLLLEETAIIARPTSGSLKQQRFESRAEQSLVAINKGQGVKKLWTSKTWMVSLENTSEILVSVKRSSMLIRWNVSQVRSERYLKHSSKDADHGRASNMGPGYGAKWSTPKFQGLIPNDPPPKLQNDCTSNLPRFKSFDSDSYPQTYLLTQKTDGSINLEISKKWQVLRVLGSTTWPITISDFFPPCFASPVGLCSMGMGMWLRNCKWFTEPINMPYIDLWWHGL